MQVYYTFNKILNYLAQMLKWCILMWSTYHNINYNYLLPFIYYYYLMRNNCTCRVFIKRFTIVCADAIYENICSCWRVMLFAGND